MRRLLISAAALGLLIGSPALAQDNNHDKHDSHKNDAPKPARTDNGGNHALPRSGGPNPYAGHGLVNPSYRGDGPGAMHRNPPAANPSMGDRNDRNPNWNRQGNQAAHRGPQPQPRNFDRRVYQRNVQAQRRFRAGFYRPPPGFYYRRWGYGQILPSIFFGQDYWLNDYYDYDLPVPPYGYQWVRYGSDAILVDRRTGQILQVEYGVFY